MDINKIENEKQLISENYDQTNDKVLLQHYKSFDQNVVLSEIEQYYKNNNSLKDIRKELLHISHKIQIPDKYINHILDYLEKEIQDQEEILTYCQILRQSIMKGSNIEIEKIIKIFKVIRNKDSLFELIRIFSIIQQQKQLKEEYLKEILNINDLDVEIRQYLIKLKYISNTKTNENSNNLQQYMVEDQKSYCNQIMVTVEHHIDYQKIYDYEDHQQISLINENYDQQITNIIDQVSTNVIENTQIIFKKNQIPSTLLKSTYETVKQIYQYAQQHKEIEQQDKDDYLPKRLFGSKYFSNGILGEYLCDRMIIETFLIISDKQQLNNITINKVFLLCKDIKRVKKLFIKNLTENIYVNSIHRSEINMENLNTIEEITKKILKVFYDFDDFHTKLSINHSSIIGDNQLTCFGDKNNEVIDKVIKIMLSEFQKIRVSAIQIINNLISKNLLILNKKQKQFIEQLQNQDEQNLKFREVALKIYIQTFNDNFKNVFDVCIKKIEKDQFEGIEYILSQILAVDRAKLLQGDKIKMIINKIISNTKQIEIEFRKKLTQIVSIFLSYDNLNISDEDFEGVFTLFLNSTDLDQQLKFNLLKSIIYFLKKYQNHIHQENKYNQLIQNLDKFEGQLQNLIILSLGTTLKREFPFKIIISDFLSNKLLVSYKINPKGMIIEDNDSKYPNIQLIVAEIIYNQVSQYKIQLEQNIINNLILILNDQDQNLKLYSAKILSQQDLNISKEYYDKLILYLYQILQDEQQGQSFIYSLLYTKTILIKQINETIEIKYIELLSQICHLDDYSEDEVYKTIQQNIITILINLTQRQENIPIEFINQFENIFIQDLELQKNIIDILKEYTKYEKLSDKIILILEIQLNKSDLQQDCLIILEQVIRKGQNVSDSTLQKYIDKISNIEEDSDKCYEILEIVERNHSLSEHIFTSIQLERAGQAIKQQSNDYYDAIDYIYQKVQEGYIISNNIFQIIGNKLDETNDKLINILECVSSNNQIIPNIIVNKLQMKLNTQNINQNVILIFINMLKNNQELSEELILKLEEMLDNQTIPKLIVQFFAISSQNCKLFSIQLIQRLCIHIQNTNDLNLELNLLQAINTKINANNLFHQDIQNLNLINQVLISKLQLSKEILIPLCLKIINYIQLHNHILDIQLQEILIKLLYEKQINYQIKIEISKILIQCELDTQTTQFIKQFLMTQNLNDNNISILNNTNEQIELLPETLDQINQILQDCKNHELLQQAISLLNNCKNKHQMPDNVIQNIVIFISYKKWRSECFKLLNQIAESKKSFPISILTFLIDNYADDLQYTSFSSEKNQIFTNKLKIIEQLDNSQYSTDLFKRINKAIKSGLQLSEQRIILFCNIFEAIYNNKDQIYIYSKILSKLLLNQLSFNENIIYQIEKLIQRNDIKITNKMIKAYTKIIEQQKYQDLQNCIGNLLKRKLQNKYKLALIECISYACQFGDKLNNTWLPILEVNLIKKSVMISNLSFKGLRIATEKGLNSEVFNEYCNIIISVLQQIKQPIERNYDLIETINYLQQCDLSDTFKRCEDWHIGLLEDGFEYKNIGCKINKIKDIIKKDEINNYIQLLKTIIQIEGLLQIQYNDLIIFIKTIGLQNTIQLLKLNIIYNSKQRKVELKWLKLIQGWLKQMIINKIKNEIIDSPYIQILTNIICTQLNCEQSSYLFEQLNQIDNFQEFQSLIEFIILNNCIIQQSKQQYTVKDLQQYFEIQIIISRFPKYKDDNNLKNIIKQLLMIGWTFQKQIELLDKVQSLNQDKKREKSVIQLFKTLYYYKVSPNIDIKDILNQREQVYNLVMEDIQNKAGAKDIQILVDELEELNKNKLNYNTDFYFNIIKNIQDRSQEILNWKLKDIEKWVKNIKNQQKEQFKNIEFIVESLAVIKQAIFINFQQLNLTYSQIMSALIILLQGDYKGVLLQVGTGEGKSIIISIIAIFYGLQGIAINIHTSSPVLAERDSKRMAPLYKIFDLECAENSDKQKYIKKVKQCYKKDIVYGDVSQFQFDYLRHHHSQLNTMGDRKMEIAIVDEVDSMLIDESSKFARLSTTIAGIDHFQPIYILIWQRIKLLEEQIIKIDSKYYYFYGNIVKNNEDKSIQILDQKGNLQRINMQQLTNLKNIGQIINNLDEFIINDLQYYIKDIMNQNQFIILPKYFTQYLELQLSNWICSALQAIKFQENINYVISEGQIKPVDFQNTGIIQNSTYWGNGLHQFLQIKHNLKLTSETFLTNFLSNVGYFKKYNNRLFGLTGTLGSQKAQDMLTQVYDVNLFFIPQNNYKLFKELPLVVLANNKKWLKEIIYSAITECNRKRGVLILCETILDARNIYEKLSLKYNRNMIKLYDMNNKFLEKDIEIINSNQIFVATNLAGRGTDIKTNNIEFYGGLHVILTFMPTNQRIEEQAFGRTARLANRGTGQMILNEYHLKHLSMDQKDYSQLKIKRDEVEAKRLQEYMDNNLKEIEQKEMYFEKFCILLNEQRQNIKSYNQLVEHYTILSIEEKWAIFLLQNQFLQENINEKFMQFENDVKELCEKKEIICNPYYKIDILQSQFKKQTLQNNKNALNAIIKVDGDQLAIVYQELAYIYLQMHNQDKNNALNNLQKTIDLLCQEVVQWQSLYVSLQKYSKNFQDSDLHQQIKQKLLIIETCANSIEANIKVIKKSQRLIDIVEQHIQQKEIKMKVINLGLMKNQAIRQCSSIETNTIQLIFNDLSYYEDYIDQDSTIKTIEQICDIDQSFNNQITLQLNEIVATKLNLLFYQNDINMGLYKEFALQKLKDQEKVNKDISSSILLITPQQNYESTTIKDAIQIIEQMNDDICIDIIFMSKLSKQWQNEILNNTYIDIEIIDLDKEKVEKELQILKSDSIDLVITSDIEDICKIINQEQTENVKHLKKQLHFLYKKEQALQIFQKIQNKKNIQTISIPNIKIEDIQKILNICKEKARFNLQFNKINNFCYMEGNQLINARFNIQNIKWSKDLIKQLRIFQLEFQLIFNNLNSNQTLNYIQNAHIQQQDVKIVNKKKLKEFNISKNFNDQQEYQNFEARGIKVIITLNENKFIPLYNMLILGTVAFSQCIIGGLLVATGFGGIIGNIILQEGISDIINLITSCYKREFSWSDYCYQKTASILCTIFTFGLKGIQDTSLARNFFQSIDKQKSINILKITSIFREAWKQSFQQFALKASNMIITKLVSTQFENAKSQLQYYLLNIIKEIFSQNDTIRLLRKIQVLNQIKKRNLVDDINKFISKILKQIGFINQFTFLFSNILIKFKSPQNLGFESWIFKITCKILQITMIILEQNLLIHSLHSLFKSQLIFFAKTEYNLQFIYQKWSNNNKSLTEKQVKENQSIKNINEYLNTLAETQDEIEKITYYNLNEELKSALIQNKTPQQLLNFLSDLTERENQFEKQVQQDELFVKVIPDIAQQLSQQIFSLVEQQILLPWISCGTFQFVDNVISNLQCEVVNKHQTEEDNQNQLEDNQNQLEDNQNQNENNQNQKEDNQHHKENHLSKIAQIQSNKEDNQNQKEENQHQKEDNQHHKENQQHQKENHLSKIAQIQSNKEDNQNQKEENQHQKEDNQHHKENQQHQKENHLSKIAQIQSNKEDNQNSKEDNQNQKEDNQHQIAYGQSIKVDNQNQIYLIQNQPIYKKEEYQNNNENDNQNKTSDIEQNIDDEKFYQKQWFQNTMWIGGGSIIGCLLFAGIINSFYKKNKNYDF